MFNTEGIRGRRMRSSPQSSVHDYTAASSHGQSTRAGGNAQKAGGSLSGGAKRHKGKKGPILVAGAVALIVGFAALAGFFFWRYNSEAGKDPNANAQAESDSIVKSVSELYLLPDGEDPTIAEIQDKEKLKDQAFFENARNGDYVLVYEKARIALLYRGSEDKLINVGPISHEAASGGQVEGQ